MTIPKWLRHPVLAHRVCLSGSSIFIDEQFVDGQAAGYTVGSALELYSPVLYSTLSAARHAGIALARQIDWEYEREPTTREQGYVNAALAEALNRAKKGSP